MHLSEEDTTAVDEAIQKFLAADMIERSPSQSTHFLSNFFTIKEATKRRPILDCKILNQFIQPQHFKMEGIPALRELLEPNDYMVKLDLKDAYTVVPIHPDYSKYLTFQHRGIVYQYKSLPFGLCTAPRIFSKLIRYAVEPLRKEGIRLVYYLDDFCVVAKSKETTLQHSQRVQDHLRKLGFIINHEKSCLIPQQQQEFLGFRFNSASMKIIAPNEKLAKLRTKIKHLKAVNYKKTCRWMAGLIGTMTSLIPAIGETLLHVRYLQRDLTLSLGKQNNWDRPFQVSQKSLQDLTWWMTWAHQKNGLPIRPTIQTTPTTTIYVDASDTGWGVASEQMEVAGFWTSPQKEESINVRELTTIWYALRLHVKSIGNTHVQIYTDNMTALKYVTKAGGTASIQLQDLALQIHELISKHNITVSFQHIRGIHNTVADRLSRTQLPWYEQKLPTKLFKRIEGRWGRRKIDAFAAAHNHQTKIYWSLVPDPQAAAVNAFHQRWPANGLYLYPPWMLIPQVLRTLRTDRVKEAILVTPFWTTQFWFPMVQQLAKDEPMLLRLSSRLTLSVWRLSGRSMRSKA
jgi:ribonuclease HI